MHAGDVRQKLECLPKVWLSSKPKTTDTYSYAQISRPFEFKMAKVLREICFSTGMMPELGFVRDLCMIPHLRQLRCQLMEPSIHKAGRFILLLSHLSSTGPVNPDMTNHTTAHRDHCGENCMAMRQLPFIDPHQRIMAANTHAPTPSLSVCACIAMDTTIIYFYIYKHQP